MQTNGNRWTRTKAQTLLATLLLTVSLSVFAQQTTPQAPTTGNIPEDYYRAEFVILERIVAPEAINERMGGHDVEPTAPSEEKLWVVAEDGTPQSTLNLAPDNTLHLSEAAARLERSGNYRILVSAGWYEAFPPDYQGEPLQVAVGDWLDGANRREVEGTITIDRKRYLHVNVHLNHWQPNPDAGGMVDAMQDPALVDQPPAEIPLADNGGDATGAPTPAMPAPVAASAPLELLTWIRETRRMRSEEIHFLDSPTISVLIFFNKVEAKP
ncbi:MAG TPA: CsiV family protein [Marinobacter sp.]|uniref:CsiV family protein n=1 Tax=Marinobacter sp. TaxID=50741 RepID=UPI002D8101A1|nr:CsiV family protein [Marinobacter sp.]HET8799685.1 CsiV family protein [Marinobacter sp.]